MRVVRIITRLNRGGPLRQLEALVPGLERLGIAGPVLAGVVPPGEDDGTEDLTRHGVEVVRIDDLVRPVRPVADRRALRRLRERLRSLRPDVVHTHTGKAGALGRIAARAEGVPVVVHTFHGHHFDLGGWRGLFARLAERRLARHTTAAIALTRGQRADLVERHRVFPAERVVVIPPTIDAAALRARATPEAIAAVRRACSRPGETVLLWLGRHVAVKDPLLLVEAFAAARAANGALRLVLAGDGPLRGAVVARAAARGVADAVTDAGPVADPAPYVGAADAVVLSSRSEGTPIAILEARALGKPVVATAVGGVRELVGGRDGDETVESGDATALGAAFARVRPRPGIGPAPAARDETVAATAALYHRLLADGGAARTGQPPRGA